MIRLAPGLLAALLLATFATASAAPAATEISVSGTGSVSQQPDVATVSAGIQTFANDVTQAVSSNNAIYARIVSALEKLGIARDDISLANYNIDYQPKPEPQAGNEIAPGPRPRYGYTVSRDFTVKVRDIAKAGSVTDACTRAGATAINGVSFGLADSAAASARATAIAVAQARAQADRLAAAAGLHVVGTKSISQNGGGEGIVQPMMRAAAASAPVPTQFDQSAVTVTVYVTITYLAEP